jgi:hypothetical protein
MIVIRNIYFIIKIERDEFTRMNYDLDDFHNKSQNKFAQKVAYLHKPL